MHYALHYVKEKKKRKKEAYWGHVWPKIWVRKAICTSRSPSPPPPPAAKIACMLDVVYDKLVTNWTATVFMILNYQLSFSVSETTRRRSKKKDVFRY